MYKQTLIALFLGLTALTYGCSDGAKQRTEEATTDPATATTDQAEEHGTEVKTIALTTPLDPKMVKEGIGIYDLKCGSCHRLDGTRLVGPGWKDVTTRRKPEWIMNMITNVDMMLEKDPEAQKMLELCLVRMPNQNITQEQARSVLEYMRQNDGVK